LSRPGARCRGCSRSVSPGRSPNPACDSHRTGLSTVCAVVAWLRRVQGLGMWLPRYRYRVTGTELRSNNAIPSAVRGRHRPSGVVNPRRMSFHFHRCLT